MKYRFSYKTLPISFRSMLIATCSISILLILRKYADHLITGYEFPFSWFDISSKIFITYLLWLILSPVIGYISHSLTVVLDHAIKKVLKILFTVVLLAILHSIISIRLYDFLFLYKSGYLRDFLGRNSIVMLSASFFSSLFELTLITSVFVAISYQKRFLVKQKQLANARLHALRMQLNPHFLFNTLNSITSMMDISIDKAQKMMIKLSTLLRIVLKEDSNKMISLKREIDFASSYLDLEQIRFEDRVKVQVNVNDELLEVKIPSLILQPLIENAVKHSVNGNSGRGEISLNVSNYEDPHGGMYLQLEIRNASELDISKNDTMNGFGIGMSNVQSRLRQIYGKNYQFTFIENGPNDYTSTIVIPKKIDAQ